MHRNDLDRHLDNMDENRRLEIMTKDTRRRPLKDSLGGRILAYLLIALLIAVLVLISR